MEGEGKGGRKGRIALKTIFDKGKRKVNTHNGTLKTRLWNWSKKGRSDAESGRQSRI